MQIMSEKSTLRHPNKIQNFASIIASFGTVRAQPHFLSHVRSMGEFSMLQMTTI